MKRGQLILFLVSLIIIGIIIALLLVSYLSKSKQEISCNIQGPFSCKEVKIDIKAQPSSQQNYVLLDATDVKELIVIPESVSVNNCISAYVDQSLFINSNNKDVKINLECPEGAKDETVTGSLEILYVALNGDVKKEKLTFSVQRVETFIQNIADIFKDETPTR